MLTNMMALVLANSGSMAAKLAKQTAQNKSVKTAAAAVVTEVAAAVIKGGPAALTRPFANRKNRSLAVQLARQIGGTYASPRAIIAGDRYWVVWAQDKTPFEVYPSLPEELGPLAERRELQNYQGNRIDPSADSS